MTTTEAGSPAVTAGHVEIAMIAEASHVAMPRVVRENAATDTHPRAMVAAPMRDHGEMDVTATAPRAVADTVADPTAGVVQVAAVTRVAVAHTVAAVNQASAVIGTKDAIATSAVMTAGRVMTHVEAGGSTAAVSAKAAVLKVSGLTGTLHRVGAVMTVAPTGATAAAMMATAEVAGPMAAEAKARMVPVMDTAVPAIVTTPGAASRVGGTRVEVRRVAVTIVAVTTVAAMPALTTSGLITIGVTATIAMIAMIGVVMTVLIAVVKVPGVDSASTNLAMGDGLNGRVAGLVVGQTVGVMMSVLVTPGSSVARRTREGLPVARVRNRPRTGLTRRTSPTRSLSVSSTGRYAHDSARCRRTTRRTWAVTW